MKFFTKFGLFICLAGILFFLIPPSSVEGSQSALWSFGLVFFFAGGVMFCFTDDEK